MRNERLFQHVKRESIFDIVGRLKVCATLKDIGEGFKLHAYIREDKYLENNLYIASTLISMYAKCGALGKVQQVLNELSVRDVVTWSALIAGYAQQGRGEEALKCYDSMQCEGHSPDTVTFSCALKACGSIGATSKGEQIHGKIVSLGMLEKDIMLGNSLVDMYAKCGVLVKAQQVLQELPFRDVVTWNTLMAGYAQQGQGQQALKCYDSMQGEGHSPNAVTFVCALKACGNIGAAAKGKQIHDKIVSLGMLEKNIMLGNTLVDMYAKCGALIMAQQVLEELPVRDVVAWSTLIAGFVQQGQGVEALTLFDSMQCEGHFPNAITFMCALKACGNVRAIARGEQIHGYIIRLGMLKKDIMLGSTLVDMYAKCGAFAKAQKVLEELPVRDVVTWNALIAGYAQDGQGEEALKCYESMQSEGHSPSAVTFTCVLKACGSIGAAAKGEQIHDKIANLGILDNNIVLGNALVDMYARCGALAKAQRVLQELPARNEISWSVLIAGYAQHAQGEEALKCFDSMLREGHTPNNLSLICALKACGSIGALSRGEEIHEKIINWGMLESDIILGSALVDMYAKCGALDKAQQTLKELPVWDVVMWNVLVAGYTEQGQVEEVLKCYDDMQHEGHSPDAATHTYALKACGSVGAAAKGKQIHDKIVSSGMLEKDVVLGSTLVDMYAKCGELAKALEVLTELSLQNAVTWNALIGGYAQQGQCVEALSSIERMQSNGVRPDSSTMICELTACSHAGLFDQAEILFLVMNTKYGITPYVEHYCCMIDLYGRVGKFYKALRLIEKMPFVEHLPLWLDLLGACCKWGEMEVGRLVFKQVCCLDKSNAGAYICIATLYRAAAMQGVDKLEVMKVADTA